MKLDKYKHADYYHKNILESLIDYKIEQYLKKCYNAIKVLMNDLHNVETDVYIDAEEKNFTIQDERIKVLKRILEFKGFKVKYTKNIIRDEFVTFRGTGISQYIKVKCYLITLSL